MILKTTFTDGQILFEDIGERFLLTSKQRCEEKFNDAAKNYYTDRLGEVPNDCYGFIGPISPGQGDIPLYADFNYHLLSEGGRSVMQLSIGGL